jgi:mono/diheme cytochrome c family protein
MIEARPIVLRVAVTMLATVGALLVGAYARGQAGAPTPEATIRDMTGRGIPDSAVTPEQVLRGRALVIRHGCGDCHGGMANPAADGWLAGAPEQAVYMAGSFRAWPRNLTPDSATGLGRYTERQVFNALRYGLLPAETPDVAVTSHIAGQGNHPAEPRYLSPAMPWLSFRFSPDQSLWDIAAYLKHGLRPVEHRVRDSEAPPDHWVGVLASAGIGTHELPPFPTAYEEAGETARLEQVLRGRALVAENACAECHGGGDPSRAGWLAGLLQPDQSGDPRCVYCQELPLGEFRLRPRNLTPDNTTGLGRFSERQIFNALRYGLRPGETADIEITSTRPGEGNHPVNPKYLGPAMPWPAWRHMSDQELRDIAAYLKHGLRAVRNRVADSEGPPDFWASFYTVEVYGPWPAPPFPTPREVRLPDA